MRHAVIAFLDARTIRAINRRSRYAHALRDVPRDLLPFWRKTAPDEFPGIPPQARFYARSLEALLTFFSCRILVAVMPRLARSAPAARVQATGTLGAMAVQAAAGAVAVAVAAIRTGNAPTDKACVRLGALARVLHKPYIAWNSCT